MAAGCSLDLPDVFPDKDPDLIRAWVYSSCMVVRPIYGMPKSGANAVCSFQWMIDCDYGGWIPKALLNLALPFAQV